MKMGRRRRCSRYLWDRTLAYPRDHPIKERQSSRTGRNCLQKISAFCCKPGDPCFADLSLELANRYHPLGDFRSAFWIWNRSPKLPRAKFDGQRFRLDLRRALGCKWPPRFSLGLSGTY